MPDIRTPKTNQASKAGTKNLIIQERDKKLLEALALLKLIDRKQAAVIARFNSLTRVNSRLLKLTRAGLLKRFFFVGELGGKKAIYSLSKKGAALIGVPPSVSSRPQDSLVIADRAVAHTLAISHVYCAAMCSPAASAKVENWQFIWKTISPAIRIIPDAYFQIQTDNMVRPMFLEVDLGTEGLPVWNKKVSEYLQLAASGEFERLFSFPRFAVLVVTASERRMHSLRKETAKATSKLLYFSTLHRIEQQGFWSQVWFRPEGNEAQSLI
jgi:hypothetical protein